MVLGQHLGLQHLDPEHAGVLGEVREHDGGEAAALQRVGDREGHLPPRRVDGDDLRVRDDPPVGTARRDEPDLVGADVGGLLRPPLHVRRAREEAEDPPLRRQPAEERGEPVGVAGADGADVDGGTVAQDDLGGGGIGHGA